MSNPKPEPPSYLDEYPDRFVEWWRSWVQDPDDSAIWEGAAAWAYDGWRAAIGLGADDGEE